MKTKLVCKYCGKRIRKINQGGGRWGMGYPDKSFYVGEPFHFSCQLKDIKAKLKGELK